MTIIIKLFIVSDALPIFHETFPEKVYHKGTSVVLKCIIYGNPPPQISWTIDGFPLPQQSKYHIQQFINMQNDVISYVNITSLAPEDGGEYTCIGKNRVGKTEYSARIDVHGKRIKTNTEMTVKSPSPPKKIQALDRVEDI